MLYRADTVNELLQAIEDDKESLRQLSSTAEVHEVNARSLLGIRERWRMPIVMKKVANGRRLNVGDAKIWKVVSKRLCIDESVNASEVIERALVAPIKQSVEAGSGVDNAKPCKSVAAAGAAAKNAAVVSLFFKSAFPKPARRSMVPAALFSHSGNAAIIKEGAAPAEANQQTLKTAVSQRSTSPQPSKKTEEGNGSVSVGFSAVSTSFKKRMGMNKAATASRLQGGTALSAVAEHDEYSHGRYGTSSHRPGPTAKILRSATASTATASCSSETSKVTTSAAPIAPIAAVSKPAVPKVVVAVSSRKVCPIATDIPEQEAVSTKMPTPQLSDRIAAGLSSLTESIRRSFSFKMQSSGAGADVSTKAGTLKVDESASEEVSGFSQKGDFSDRMADVSDTEKSPLLTSRPSSQDLEAAAPAQVAVPEPLSQEVFSSFNSCPGTAAATKEHGKDVGAPMPQKVAAPHRRGHFAASEADDSVTPKTLEMYKNKQAAAKHSKGSPTPSASIPLQPPAKAVKGWLSWSSQKKVAKQVEASTDCASPRTDKSTAAAAASQATPENSQRTTPRAASLSRAAVSYQELVEKRQQLQTERSVRALGTKGGTGRLAPATAMRQIWSSLLGSEKKKITPAE